MRLFRKQSVDPDGGVLEEDEIEPMKWRDDDPELSANLFSRLTFLWIQPMFSRAAFLRTKGRWLEQEDLPAIASLDRSENVQKLFEEAYAQYSPKTSSAKKEGGADIERTEELERRLVHALFATCKRFVIEGGIFRFVNSCLQFSFPIILNFILSYCESGALPMYYCTNNFCRVHFI